jgi:hypothetical protein
MNKFILTMMAFYFSCSIHAQCIPDHCGGVYVERLYVESSGTIYIGTSGDESKLNCQAVAGVYVTIPPTHKGAQALYSMLLTAQAANKVLSTIQVDDNQPGCIVQYITLDRQ